MSNTHVLKTTEVCQMLGISRDTLFRWRKKGIITPVSASIGGHNRFLKSDVEKLLERK